MEEWVVVLQTDHEESDEQLKVCRALKPSLAGVVVCEPDSSAPLCNDLTNFPAFCHKPTNACTVGLRTTSQAMQELLTMAVDPTAPSLPTAEPPPSDPEAAAAPLLFDMDEDAPLAVVK